MAQVTQPFNYLKAVQNPAQEALQAFQGAYQARQQQQQNEMFRSAFNEFARKPNKGVSDYVQLLQVTPPEMVNTVKASFEAMTEEQQDASKRDLSQLIFAFKYDPERGKGLLDQRLEAARNAGDMQETQSLQTIRKLADIDADSVVEALAMQGGMAFGSEFIEMAVGKPAPMPKIKDVETFAESGLRVETYENGQRRIYEGARLVSDPSEAARLENAARVAQEKSEKKGVGERTDVGSGVYYVEYNDGSRDVFRNGARIADEAEAAKAVSDGLAAQPLEPEEQQKAEDVLRKEWLNVTKENRAIRNNYDKVRAAAVQNTPGADLSLVFAYMKILDPTSVVRESEQASATNAAGVPDRIRNLFNRVQEGTRLTPTQRADFLARAGDLVRGYQASQDEIMAEYQTVSDNRGLNADNIFVGYQPITEEQLQSDVTQAASIATGADMTAPRAGMTLTPAQIAALREAGIDPARLLGGQ